MVKLDAASIGNAISELEAYKKTLQDKTTQLIQALIHEGVILAKQEVLSLGAFDSGELHDSLSGLMYTDGRSGIIFTGSGHAAFVEFGTGVIGASNAHPTMPWAYDVNNHGEDGWVYYDEKQGRFRWTKGMPSRPYMYNTSKLLRDKVAALAREVFKK